MRFLLLVGILVLNIAALAADETVYEGISNAVYPAGLFTRRSSVRRVIDGTAHFSGKFIQQVAASDENNLIVSPLGAALALGLTSFGARGNTQLLLQRALGLDYSINRRKIGFQSVIDHLNSFKAVELQFATGLFLGGVYEFNPDFVESSVRAFRSTVQHVDFVRSEETSSLINKWCYAKTNHRIDSIVNPDDLDGDTVMVIVNALYFKGTWLNQFNAEDTMDSPFYLKNGTMINVPTMSAKNIVRHGIYKPMDADFIELPYVSHDHQHNVSMFFILPRDFKDLTVVEANLPNLNIASLLNTGKIEMVNIRIPKFKIEKEIDLKEPLERMKLGNLFNMYKGNFSGIIRESKLVDEDLQDLQDDFKYVRPSALVIDKIVQKAFIEVNEEGSEAAAATAETFSTRMGGGRQDPSFWANHPFYAILATTGPKPIILFAARYTGLE